MEHRTLAFLPSPLPITSSDRVDAAAVEAEDLAISVAVRNGPPGFAARLAYGMLCALRVADRAPECEQDASAG